MNEEMYVAWHCTACGYEHESATYSYSRPCDCPKCNAKGTVYQGAKRLPVNSVRCDENPKQYDLCGGPKEVQVRLSAATGERCGVCMRPEEAPDCDDHPISVAEAVLTYANKCIYYSGLDKLKAVVAAMKACERMSDINEARNTINFSRERIMIARCDIANAKDVLDESQEEGR